MLTNAAAKAATAQARAYKLFDAGGLFLFVAPSGLKSWRLKYRFAGREKLLTLGRFPEVALAEARARREAAKEALRAGTDPAGAGTDEHGGGNSFEAIARAWHAHRRDEWSATHATDVLASLERDIFPQLGAMPIGSIDPPALLAALRAVEKRGCIPTAQRERQRLSKIFGYAKAEGHIDSDPAATLGDALRRPRHARPQPALTRIEDCRALLAACERVDTKVNIRLASRFLALTAVRLDAVRGMRWSEVEGIDRPAPLWRVPPARMKLAKGKKGDECFEHLAPLSPQAVAVLREAMSKNWPNLDIAADRNAIFDMLVFPGSAAGAPIGENAIGTLYARAGFAGRHVPHGWRASFSTILNIEMGREWRDDINSALAHAEKNKDKVEAAYNRSILLDRRREVFNRWGETLAD